MLLTGVRIILVVQRKRVSQRERSILLVAKAFKRLLQIQFKMENKTYLGLIQKVDNSGTRGNKVRYIL